MLNTIKKAITNGNTQTTDYWFTNETFNTLLADAKEVRVSNDGVLELEFESGEVLGVSVRSMLLRRNNDKAHVQLKYLDLGHERYETGRNNKYCDVL